LNPTIAELSQAIEKGVENCLEHMVAENIAVTLMDQESPAIFNRP
jgi:hypothetical protein